MPRVFNPQNVAVVVDDGRTVGSSEWATLEDSDLVQQLINSGRLLVVSDPTPPQEKTVEPYLGEPAEKSTSQVVRKSARTS